MTAPAMRRAVSRLVPPRRRPALVGTVRAAAYRGTAVMCPCCETGFRAFRPHRGRPRARCPRCGALERHRALWLWLDECSGLSTEPMRVLHVAPEYELQRRLMRLPQLSYLSADLNSPLAMVRADVMDTPFADGEFDVVLCNHVLEHVADDRRAMAEIRRVLRPGGWAVLLVPVDPDRTFTFEAPAIVDPAQRLRIYGQEDHARVYGRDYPQRLAAAGFDVEVVDGAAGRTEEEVRRYGLARAGRVEEIYVARRPVA